MEIKNIRKLQNGSDVRGVVLDGVPGEVVNFTQDMTMKIAFSFAIWLEKKLGKKAPLSVAVGRDSRISGPHLAQAVALGLVGVVLYVRNKKS